MDILSNTMHPAEIIVCVNIINIICIFNRLLKMAPENH